MHICLVIAECFTNVYFHIGTPNFKMHVSIICMHGRCCNLLSVMSPAALANASRLETQASVPHAVGVATPSGGTRKPTPSGGSRKPASPSGSRNPASSSGSRQRHPVASQRLPVGAANAPRWEPQANALRSEPKANALRWEPQPNTLRCEPPPVG